MKKIDDLFEDRMKKSSKVSDEIIKKIIRRASEETVIKDVSSLAFHKIWKSLGELLKPIFDRKRSEK